VTAAAAPPAAANAPSATVAPSSVLPQTGQMQSDRNWAGILALIAAATVVIAGMTLRFRTAKRHQH
jgi:LPXTG-motif cell wall-anchored protein